MLKNRAGLRIAVLVNDVADVNVDAQLIRRAAVDESGVEMVELENGCVCCGPGAGGLAPAVLTLANRVDESGAAAFDHVVVEMSGVADPTNVERNLNAGGVAMERKVALVDANAFPAMYNSVEEMGERIDLAGPSLNADPCAVDRRVVELLLVQIETADVILINKCDLASEEERRITISACRALNDNAEIVSTTYGDAAVSAILPLNGATMTVCDKPGCTDPSHDHSHAHEHSHASDDAHEHSHEHSHGGGGCDDPACTDPSHDHSHDAATCTDPTHDHSTTAAMPTLTMGTAATTRCAPIRATTTRTRRCPTRPTRWASRRISTARDAPLCRIASCSSCARGRSPRRMSSLSRTCRRQEQSPSIACEKRAGQRARARRLQMCCAPRAPAGWISSIA